MECAINVVLFYSNLMSLPSFRCYNNIMWSVLLLPDGTIEGSGPTWQAVQTCQWSSSLPVWCRLPVVAVLCSGLTVPHYCAPSAPPLCPYRAPTPPYVAHNVVLMCPYSASSPLCSICSPPVSPQCSLLTVPLLWPKRDSSLHSIMIPGSYFVLAKRRLYCAPSGPNHAPSVPLPCSYRPLTIIPPAHTIILPRYRKKGGRLMHPYII